MIFARLAQGRPEIVYAVCRNSTATTLSVGWGVLWDATIAGSAAYDGWAVTLPPTGTAVGSNPGLFAGVVSGTQIEPGSNGYIQVWGIHNSVSLHGTTGVPFLGGATQWDQASLTNRVLRPLNLYITNTVVTGYLGAVTVGDAMTHPGGYILPLSYIYTTVDATGNPVSGTLGSTGTGWCKAFLKCL